MIQIPPGPLSRETAGRLMQAINELQGRRTPPQNYRGGQFTTDTLPLDVFPAKLTAVSSGLYSWTEQVATGADYAGWTDLNGGRSGTNTIQPAFEPNDAAIDVSANPVVYLTPAYYDASLETVFAVVGAIDSGGGGSSLITTNGSLTINPTTTLLIDNLNLILSNPSAGVAKVQAQNQSIQTVNTGGSQAFPGALGSLDILTLTPTGSGFYIVTGNVTFMTATSAPGYAGTILQIAGPGVPLAAQDAIFDPGGTGAQGLSSLTWMGNIPGASSIKLTLNTALTGTVVASLSAIPVYP